MRITDGPLEPIATQLLDTTVARPRDDRVLRPLAKKLRLCVKSRLLVV